MSGDQFIETIGVVGPAVYKILSDRDDAVNGGKIQCPERVALVPRRNQSAPSQQ